MKILLVHGTEKISGAENVSLNIAINLRNNYEFCFFVPGEPVSKKKFLNFNVFYPASRGFLNLLKTLKKVIDAEKPDIIHAQGTRAAFFVKFAFMFGARRAKFIYTLHGIHFTKRSFPFNFLTLLCEGLTNSYVDALVCVGKDDFDLAMKLKLIRPRRLFSIDNGIDVEVFPGGNEDLKRKLGAEGKIVIITICRLHRQKDVGSLIGAIPLLKGENIKLLVVGDGPERAGLEKLSRDLGVEGAIDFLGARNDVDDLLSITDIFILSTHWEGQPLVVLEAWAHKNPVIASNVHGVRDLIEDGENGLLFEHGNPKALSEKIKLVLRNGRLGIKLGENGYGTVKSKYTSKIMSENYDKLYWEISHENSSDQ
jgi:glycosyltransferase involved in cell wall biosynthesis